MSSHQPYNAILPVVLVSSAVFSLLTLPFFIYRSQPEANTLSLRRDFQPILETQNRDLTIRYIGAAMVISVVAGIGTIELQKKRQPRQVASLQPTVDRQNMIEPFATSSPAQPLLEPTALITEFDTAFATELEMEFEIETDELAEAILPPTVLLDDIPTQNLAQETYEMPASLVRPQAQGVIIELEDQNYSTCRIWVEHLQRRLFAIHIGGQFYSFFRLLPTQEAARQIALQLSENSGENLNQIVITPVEQDYAVWVWQPEAELERRLA